jgi:hypothetical protein
MGIFLLLYSHPCWMVAYLQLLMTAAYGLLANTLFTGCHCQSQSNVMTDSQLASLFWCQASIWGPRPNFYYCQTVVGMLMWAVLSNKRTGLSFTIASGPRQLSHSQVWVLWESWPYFTVSDSRLPPTWRARSQYLYPPGTVCPSYIPRHWVPFLSPPMTCRATMGVFESAVTRGWLSLWLSLAWRL